MATKAGTMTLLGWLRWEYDPCYEAVKWLTDAGITDPQEAWQRCPRADWMIWLLDAQEYFDVTVCRELSRWVGHREAGRLWQVLPFEYSSYRPEPSAEAKRADKLRTLIPDWPL